MQRRYLILLVVLALIGGALVLLMRAKPNTITPEAAKELEELMLTDIPAMESSAQAAPELIEPLRDVLSHFEKTKDVHYTAPNSTISPLHVACLFKKAELTRCLLEHGADPNLHGEDDDSPLLLALSTYLTPDATAQDILPLVDTLLAGGAEFAKSGHTAGDFLTQAALLCENEELILYLMEKKGAGPDADTAAPLALHGWATALARVLEAQPSTRGLLHTAALGSASFEGDYPACIELLLKHGAGINDDEDEGQTGVTPLFRLAEALSDMPESAPRRTQAMETLKCLLEHGADPYLRADGDEAHPGFCPYELLALRPGLVEELAEYGLPQQAPPLRISSGASLLADVCRMSLADPGAEQIAEHYDTIATLLTPSAEMLQQELYPQALQAAVALLARADAARTTELLLGSPLWQMSSSTSPAVGEAHAALLTALRDLPAICFPKEFICATADRWAAENAPDEAAAMVELLARCPDAHEEIARYCADELLPLQAGAYAALLSARNLPDARDSGVQNWLKLHHREADTDFLREALLLTSLERLWYGQMPAEEQEKLLLLMRRIEAPAAAAAYEQISRHLDDPDTLDAIISQGTAWKYELEVATARFFLEHAEAFATPAS